MVAALAWRPAYRIIDSRFPFVGIYDRIADPAVLEDAIEIEAITNSRIRDEVGNITLVRPEDRISGPGATPVMAAFTHARPSRFSDGSFGIYYAAQTQDTAIAEVRHHKIAFLSATHEPSIDLDMRVYAADITGSFDDLRELDRGDPTLDPRSYTHSRTFGAARLEANASDGIVYPSVRDMNGTCVAVFRPRCVTHCHPIAYLGFRWNGTTIAEVYERARIMRFSDP